jgi:hypothetical protein
LCGLSGHAPGVIVECALQIFSRVVGYVSHRSKSKRACEKDVEKAEFWGLVVPGNR